MDNPEQPITLRAEGGNPTGDDVIATALEGFTDNPESVTVDGLERLYDLMLKTHGEKAANDLIYKLQSAFSARGHRDQFKIVDDVIRKIHQAKRAKAEADAAFFQNLSTD